MKRKILSFVLAAVLLLTAALISACDEKKEDEEPKTGNETAPGCVIRAEYAGDSLPDHYEFAADEGEYAVKVLLSADAPAEKFTFFSLVYEDMDGDEPIFSVVELYEIPDFGPDKPLVVSMTFGEIFPAYGFTYKNADGIFKTYGITQSGKDGSVVGGHLNSATVSATCEMFITVLDGTVERRRDDEVGLNLFEFV